MQFVTIFRRNVWRDAPSTPPNVQNCMAGVSAISAEIAQVQRMFPVYPPRAELACREAVAREQSAENANTKCENI